MEYFNENTARKIDALSGDQKPWTLSPAFRKFIDALVEEMVQEDMALQSERKELCQTQLN